MDATLVPPLSEYVYAPLPSVNLVRYVELSPGVGDVECVIFEASIDEAVSYTALSYAWGPDSNPRRVRCSSTHYLTVRSNLYEALRQIRHPTEPWILWIDAICINQNDIFERNQQVAQMTKIYTQAEKLLIWLGNDKNETAVNVIKHIAEFSTEREAAAPLRVRPRLHLQDWKAMKTFLGATWFQRVWIIQELVLGLRLKGPAATEVLCGIQSVTWNELSICLRYIKRQYTTLVATSSSCADAELVRRRISKFGHLNDAANLRSTQSQTELEWTRWLMNKLPEVRAKKCSDPRDRIYAFYGLCRASPQPLPDYSSSVSDVYRKFTVDAIRITRSLSILNDIEVRSRSTQIQVPSWVPDWTVRLDRYTFREKNFLNDVGLSRVPESVPMVEMSTLDSPEVLHLTGVVLDEIVYVCDSVRTVEMKHLYDGGGSWVQTAWHSILAWRRSISGPQTSRFGSDIAGHLTSDHWQMSTKPTFTDFVYTIITNKELSGLDELIRDSEARFFEILNHTSRNPAIPLRTFLREDVKARSRRVVRGSSPNETTQSPERQILDRTATRENRPNLIMTSEGALPPDQAKVVIMTSYLQYLNKRGQGRRIFVTKNGLMGLGVASTAIGDHVAVLSTYGNVGRTPYCIRPKGMHYEFVGEAYVHGLHFDDNSELHWEKIDLI